MIDTESNILDLIPQRPPFVFVDRLLEVSGQKAVSQFTITDNCPLLQENDLTSAGLLENMAQTCAARTGYIQTRQQEPVRIGYIGAVREMTIEQHPHLHDTITTEVILLEHVFDISLFQCKCYSNDILIAQALLKLAIN